ncbi:hypothetical protein F0562_029210 [Nyssa sinensis]|uniref:DCD domain-containing protein n=1 Tax=Nyssa sinensis TaxID=561372 RepID=A0A5J5B4E8_9ASTE|nr:hypothetical protein F0562_029210 [Nyssa sinensis]
MGSLGAEVAKKKAMWLYPKLMGFNPSERWGHSACYSNGFVYVFGGCCGGLHFGDVLVLNLDTMAWNTLVTSGEGPGPRDSHSAVLVEHRMIVFGGTNGSKKVNDLHILDLRTREWTRPDFKGVPPSPRESHTATLLGDEKMVIFGGSGEGEANYLNDLHVLDLKTMRWTSPEVKGNIPVPRDSHTAVVVGNKLFVYGGDCGDRYQGDVNMLDMNTQTWSRLGIQGFSPGVRAGHAAVNIGTKVYIIGGVGDKQYYNDVWVLDVSTCLWTQLEIRGQQPQGRFSHTAVVTETDIAVYGGCGEDERPLNELVVLQLGAEHPNGRYNISLCKIFGNHYNQEKRRVLREVENNSRMMLLGNNGEVVRKEARERESESKQSFRFSSDTLHLKRRRTRNSKIWEMELEPEEHSLSLSQNSSPSQSDQEQTPVKKATNSVTAAQVFPLFKQQNQILSTYHSNNVPSNQTNPKSIVRRTSQDLHFSGEHLNQPNPEQYLHVVHSGRHEAHHPAAEQKPSESGPIKNLIGAEIQGKVDGAFDSGYLMTATVNGKIFRGVLFAPGPDVVSRSTILGPKPLSLTSQMALNHTSPIFSRHSQQPTTFSFPESGQSFHQAQVTRPSPVIRATPSLGREPKLRSDLQGVVLTLGGPGTGVMADHR